MQAKCINDTWYIGVDFDSISAVGNIDSVENSQVNWMDNPIHRSIHYANIMILKITLKSPTTLKHLWNYTEKLYKR